ncbi:DNA translocase FtsK [Amnibacterium sp. CER49]|uniref:DNA translocase FtsK n=1 Tax=Amnibacterium sp. CER49 TaxID=3039161 RepID=UPI00244AE197|nr:DNA translocase FtsK [Amnibacterium sp. CER49]MDH2444470.1 DNA translocase FtsK [Amnibacterium sp. CER49]
MPAPILDLRATLLLVGGLAVVVVLLVFVWPLGALAGIALSAWAVLAIGTALQREADEQLAAGRAELAAALAAERREVLQPTEAPVAPAPLVEPVRSDPVRSGPARPGARSAEIDRDVARAARLVVATQYASAARLQRELHVPYSRARRILDDLEQRRLVGPAAGTAPRRVLLPKERLPELESVLAAD